MGTQRLKLLSLAATLLLVGCQQQEQSLSVEQEEVAPTVQQEQQIPTTATWMGELSGFTLWAEQADPNSGVSELFYLESEGSVYSYTWYMENNLNHLPTMHLADLNGDDKDELIISLVTGTGTGAHLEELHILNPETGAVYPMDAPDEVMTEQVSSYATEDSYYLLVAGMEHILRKSDYPNSVASADAVHFGNIDCYIWQEGNLYYHATGQISPVTFIGDVRMECVWKENRFTFVNPVYVTETIK